MVAQTTQRITAEATGSGPEANGNSNTAQNIINVPVCPIGKTGEPHWGIWWLLVSYSVFYMVDKNYFAIS